MYLESSLPTHHENFCQTNAKFAASSKLKLLLGCVIIAVACFVAYFPAIRGDFIWDDDRYVTNNKLLTAPGGLWHIWFSTDMPSQYFPLTYTTFWLEYRLWGFNPVPYHIANIVLHIISSLLLWLILRRLSISAAFVAAAVFALHPVNVESVAWITERKNVLMLVFSLLSIIFWISISLRTQTKQKMVLFYVFSLLFYAIALLSKTTACILPVALVLIVWVKGVAVSVRRLLLIVPYIVLGLAMGLLSVWWEHHHQGIVLIDLGLGPVERVLIATKAVWFYAGKLFFPVNLAFSYPRWNINPADPSQYLGLLACLLTAAGLWFWRKTLGRGVIAAVIFFVAALFPTLGFLDLYTFVYTWLADHYQYMASIALITLAVATVSQLLTRLGTFVRKITPLFAVILLFAFAALTWRQSRIYTNLESLWTDTLKKNPDSWLAHNNISQVLLAQGRTDEAIYHITRALDCIKNTPALHPYNIAGTHCNLALAYRDQKKYQDAIAQYRIAMEIYPYDSGVHFELADLLESLGQFDEAVIQYKQAVKIRPNAEMWHYRLADALTKTGDIPNAIAQLHRALDIKPDYVTALDKLIGLFITSMDPNIRCQTKAIEYARLTVAKTNHQNPIALNLLAMAYAADGQYTQAVNTAQQALDVAVATGANDLTDFIRTQLETYKKRLKSD